MQSKYIEATRRMRPVANTHVLKDVHLRAVSENLLNSALDSRMLALPDEGCVRLMRWPPTNGAGTPVRVPLEATASPPLFLEWGPPGSNLLAVGGPSLLQVFQVVSEGKSNASSAVVARSVLEVASAPLANRPVGLAWHPKVAILAVFDNMGAQLFSLRSPSRMGAAPCGRIAFGVPRANKCGTFVLSTEGDGAGGAGGAGGDVTEETSSKQVDYIALAMAGSSELNVWRLRSDGSDLDGLESAELPMLSGHQAHRCFAVDGLLLSRKRHCEDEAEAQVGDDMRGQFRSLLPVQLPERSHQAASIASTEHGGLSTAKPIHKSVYMVGGLDGEAMVRAISDGLETLLSSNGRQLSANRHGSGTGSDGPLLLPSFSAVNDLGGSSGGGFRRTLPGVPSRKGSASTIPAAAAADVDAAPDANEALIVNTETKSNSFSVNKGAASVAIQELISEASPDKTTIDLRGRLGERTGTSKLMTPPDAAAALFDLSLLGSGYPSKGQASRSGLVRNGNQVAGSSDSDNSGTAAACVALFALTSVSGRSATSSQSGDGSGSGSNGKSSEVLRAVCAAALPKPMQAPDLLAAKSPVLEAASGQQLSSASMPGFVAVGCLSSRTVALFELSADAGGGQPRLRLLDTAQIPANYRPRGLAFEALPDDGSNQSAVPKTSTALITHLAVLCAARSVDCIDEGQADAGVDTKTQLANSTHKSDKAWQPLPTSLTKSPTQPYNAHVLYFRCPETSLSQKVATSAASRVEASNADSKTKATVAVASALEGSEANASTAGKPTTVHPRAAAETAARAQARTQIRAQFEALMLGDEALRESDDVDATHESDIRSCSNFGVGSDSLRAQNGSNHTAALGVSAQQTTALEHFSQSDHALASTSSGVIMPAHDQSSRTKGSAVDDRSGRCNGSVLTGVGNYSNVQNGHKSSSTGSMSHGSQASAVLGTPDQPKVGGSSGSINAEGMVALAMALGQLEARLTSKLDSALQLAREHSERLTRLESTIEARQNPRPPP